jgi:hypothetical protein
VSAGKNRGLATADEKDKVEKKVEGVQKDREKGEERGD